MHMKSKQGGDRQTSCCTALLATGVGMSLSGASLLAPPAAAGLEPGKPCAASAVCPPPEGSLTAPPACFPGLWSGGSSAGVSASSRDGCSG